MFQIQTQQKGIELIVFISPDVPDKVKSDARRMKQIIINLISNALKFTYRGSITLSCDFKDRMLHFSIKDTGLGISDEDQQKLFKLFGKLKSNSSHNRQGIGLGLNICMQIVNAFGGNVGVTSKLGEGSTFNFTWEVAEFEY